MSAPRGAPLSARGDPVATGDVRSKPARRFRGQAASCAELGSPLYGALLQRAAADIDAGGAVWDALAPAADVPGGLLLALRFMGATHRLALTGEAPDLAAHYPSCGGDGDVDAAWEALRALAATPLVTPLLSRGVQTNEVGRSAALLGGFLTVAREWGLPLRLLEVGASAGLNLRFDRYHYDGWGDPTSPVDQGDPWIGGHRPELSPSRVEIAERRGCDVSPIDATSAEGRLTLLSFVWPDMQRRFALLDGACRVAATVPVAVDVSSGDTWIAEQLATPATPADGAATVVFHSVVLQYMAPEARAGLSETLALAGGWATARAPLAWLRMEPPGPLGPADFEIRLTTWPGGADRRLASCHPHGIWVRWEA